MNTQVKERRQVDEIRSRIPAEHDWDWEYTGDFFVCLDCGHEFRQPPYNFDICPECGADFWPAEQ